MDARTVLMAKRCCASCLKIPVPETDSAETVLCTRLHGRNARRARGPGGQRPSAPAPLTVAGEFKLCRLLARLVLLGSRHDARTWGLALPPPMNFTLTCMAVRGIEQDGLARPQLYSTLNVKFDNAYQLSSGQFPVSQFPVSYHSGTYAFSLLQICLQHLLVRAPADRMSVVFLKRRDTERHGSVRYRGSLNTAKNVPMW